MISDSASEHEQRGPIAYMARNGVAANLLMFFIVAAGLVSLTGLVQEAFPVIAFNRIEVSVPYPGATPDEVEEAIVVKIEEQIAALDAVKEVSSVAAEGVASVMAALETGTNVSQALEDVKSAVDRIQTFPSGAERPEIKEMTNRQSVIRLILHGDVPERALKELAYRMEEELAALPAVSYVETSGVRADEISVEVPLHQLRALGLTLEDVSNAIRTGSLDLSAGRIRTADAQVRVRTRGQSYDQQDFEQIIVRSGADGTVLRLGDIATVRDGFRDVDLIARYDGKPAAFVEVYRSGGEQVLDVARAVERHVESVLVPSLPAGVGVTIWNNDAAVYRDRLLLLLKNGSLGLMLVLLALALFLQTRLAVWVAAGIGISAVGTLTAMLLLGVSLNFVSLFAFILAIGVVVDDAIVVAEQIHLERRTAASGTIAAIRGTRRIKRPLIFAVLTSIAAFSPLLFLPGGVGDLMSAIPIILIAMLVLSLVESLLILPNHLSHLPGPEWKPSNAVDRFFAAVQARVDRGLTWFVQGPLHRALRLATGEPALVLCGALGITVLVVALVPAGIVRTSLVDTVESDIVTANLETPAGTPAARTVEVAESLEAAGRRAIDRLSTDQPEGAAPLLVGVNLTVGARARQEGGGVAHEPSLNPQGHKATVEFRLLEARRRRVSATTVLQEWRREAGEVPAASNLAFTAQLVNVGRPVHIELSHPDPERLGAIGDAVVEGLRTLPGVFDIQSDHDTGLAELQVELKPEARTLGLTLEGLARQVRSAFFGAEAVRVQRGREEVRVYVRLPAEERDAIADVERYMIRTPAGAATPLSRVAALSSAESPALIRRRDGERTVTVTADVDAGVLTGGQATASLEETVLPQLLERNPGLAYSFGGAQQEQLESFGALGRGFVLAMLLIYALLAIPLGSYTRPLTIIATVPFGIVGAILGHLILGIDMSLASMMGILGLSGVVVNDSLVMLDHIDQRLKAGRPARTAIIEGAQRRFRPIFLTSLTTFLGFTPLILERATQAKFLLPFAASMGFGIAFATIVLMVVVPALTAMTLRPGAHPASP